MSLFLLTVVFLLGLAIGVPVAITLGVASLAYILSSGIPLVVVPQKMFAGMDIYVLLCIPGFVLAGNLMNAGGITPRIISFAQAGVGWMRGGLGMTNVASSMLFGGISGTAVADAASIGGMMIPGMKRAGYPADFSAAVTSASSTIGPIIPPDYRWRTFRDFGRQDVYCRDYSGVIAWRRHVDHYLYSFCTP